MTCNGDHMNSRVVTYVTNTDVVISVVTRLTGGYEAFILVTRDYGDGCDNRLTLVTVIDGGDKFGDVY